MDREEAPFQTCPAGGTILGEWSRQASKQDAKLMTQQGEWLRTQVLLRACLQDVNHGSVLGAQRDDFWDGRTGTNNPMQRNERMRQPGVAPCQCKVGAAILVGFRGPGTSDRQLCNKSKDRRSAGLMATMDRVAWRDSRYSFITSWSIAALAPLLLYYNHSRCTGVRVAMCVRSVRQFTMVYSWYLGLRPCCTNHQKSSERQDTSTPRAIANLTLLIKQIV